MDKKKRIRDYGISIGIMKPGPLNKITDVPGVLVGHKTIKGGSHNTGVTVICPCPFNPYVNKPVAASYVHNGFGKSLGLAQIEELGTIETPIALTNTLNVGLVHDALTSYMIDLCRKDGFNLKTVNPIVGECNDSRINAIADRVVRKQDVFDALSYAGIEFEEGAVGAGTGTICHGLKGGIGSASREIPINGKTYTLGVLVQSNYGSTTDLLLCGRPIGLDIFEKMQDPSRYPMFAHSEEDRGSIMIILATDLPVSDRQLKRIIRRCGNGLARMGSINGNGSGDFMIGFTTANTISSDSSVYVQKQKVLREDLLSQAFRAAGECTEEAVLNSMVTADRAVTLSGKIIYSLRDFL